MSELKKEPRVCEICGGKFIPVRKDQRLCPDCRAGKHKYAAAKKPSDVEHYTLGETPEQAMPEPEIPEKPYMDEKTKEVQPLVNIDGFEVGSEEPAGNFTVVLSGCTVNVYFGGK